MTMIKNILSKVTIEDLRAFRYDSGVYRSSADYIYAYRDWMKICWLRF